MSLGDWGELLTQGMDDYPFHVASQKIMENLKRFFPFPFSFSFFLLQGLVGLSSLNPHEIELVH